MSIAHLILPPHQRQYRPGRHPGDVGAKVALIQEALTMTPQQRAVYNHVLVRCYLMPAYDDLDKVFKVSRSPAVVGRKLGMDPSDASKAIRALESEGWIVFDGKTMYPCYDRFMEEVTRVLQEIKEEMADLEGPADESGEFPPVGGVSPGPEPPSGDFPPEPAESGEIPRGDSPDRGTFPRPVAPAPGERAREGATAGTRTGAGSRSVLNPEKIRQDSSAICLSESRASDAGAHEGTAGPERYTQTAYSGTSEPSRAEFSPEEASWIEATLERAAPLRHQGYNLMSNLAPAGEGYSFERVKKAIKRACLMRKPNWSYIKQILDQWTAIGGADPGVEDRYDDQLQPLAAPAGWSPDLAPAAAPAPDRPLSRFQQTMENVRKMEAANKAGIHWLKVPIEEGGA